MGNFPQRLFQYILIKSYMTAIIVLFFAGSEQGGPDELKSLFIYQVMENPSFEFMAGFPARCSCHQPCVSHVNCNGTTIEGRQKGYLEIVLLYQPKYFVVLVVKCGDLCSCAYSTWVPQELCLAQFKAVAFKWQHVPLISASTLPPILYSPSHPILPHLMSLQLFLNFFPWGAICIPAWGENVIHPAEVKPWLMWRAGGGERQTFSVSLHGNVKLGIMCLSDTRFTVDVCAGTDQWNQFKFREKCFQD